MRGPLGGADLDTWALAMAALDRTSPEPPQQRAARERYDRRLLRVAVAFSGTVVVLALLMALLDPGDDRSTWRFVTGVTVAVLALLVLIGGPLARPGGATLQGVGHLDWLTLRQRMELRRQVRGGKAVPDRLSLARRQARAMLDGRVAVLPQVGLAMAFVGSWMMKPTGYRAVVALFSVGAVAGLALHQRREERLARRFLAEHPEPAP